MANAAWGDPEDRFGRNMRKAREELDISQADLAARCREHGVHLHPTAIAKIEARDAQKPRAIRLNEAVALADALGYSVQDLLRGPGSIFAMTAARLEDALEWQRKVDEEVSEALDLLRDSAEFLSEGQTAADLAREPALEADRKRIIVALAQIGRGQDHPDRERAFEAELDALDERLRAVRGEVEAARAEWLAFVAERVGESSREPGDDDGQ